MSRGVRVLLWAFVAVSILLFLAVSYDNTRQIAGNFHLGWDAAPIVFALAAELGVIGCSIARVLRERAGLDARGFTWTLAGVLGISFVANALAGAQAFVPEAGVLDFVRARWYLCVPLIAAFSALVPVLIFSFSELFATLVSESARPEPQRPLRMRITEIYSAQPELPPAQVAQLVGCHPSTVRRVRAELLQSGGRRD